MTLDELHAQWGRHLTIDRSRLDEEAANIPNLHHIYWRLLLSAKKDQRQLQKKLDALKHLKIEYFTNKMTDQQRMSLGWPPQELRILKPDVDRYINHEPDVTLLQQELDEVNDMVEFLAEIVKTINNRNYLIRSAIDFLKFSQGL